MALSKKQRKQVFDKSDGHCWYCGVVLPKKGWHVDHVKPVYRERAKPTKGSAFGAVPKAVKDLLSDKMWKPENDHIENMVPACASCNLFKSVFSVEEFRGEVQAQTERCRRTSVNFRTAERFGLIEVNSSPVVFWFEKNKENK